jgi:hypothetical protein
MIMKAKKMVISIKRFLPISSEEVADEEPAAEEPATEPESVPDHSTEQPEGIIPCYLHVPQP